MAKKVIVGRVGRVVLPTSIPISEAEICPGLDNCLLYRPLNVVR